MGSLTWVRSPRLHQLLLRGWFVSGNPHFVNQKQPIAAPTWFTIASLTMGQHVVTKGFFVLPTAAPVWFTNRPKRPLHRLHGRGKVRGADTRV